ncbi:hypothetical protein Y032_0200g1708 [Ancylostoma ceylanicum]|uniref:Uncharacterized protein n=1 Tax=Ancylostoma ceylanicum TaxID=53326 RepID=A0A016SNP8_9BILA|nr:hypothetical protein Y032_0200g1708 [Ancylostoma ceylanicum]
MEYEGKFYSELYCQELGVSIATNSVSRLFNSLNTAISLISLVLLMDVAIRHRKRFICHVSLTVRYLTLSFTFTTPCSLFISKSEYAIVQIIFTYSIIWMENIQFALVVERVVASIFTEWRSFELSCRFQSEENASTAFLVCGILVTHYCVFLIYRSLYLLTNVVADTPRELEVYRSASHVLSLSPLLLGILTIWYFREVRRTRKMRITTLVSMQSNGADGWNNYASVLGSQWSRQ